MTTPPTITSEKFTNDLTHESDEDFEIIHKSSESLCNVSAETYLSLPEEILALSSVHELESAIENCKSVILSKPENSEERKWLVRRIIELRLRLENIKDSDEKTANEDSIKKKNKVVLGHHFILQKFATVRTDYYCDRCSNVIWHIFCNWYLCLDCKYKCHEECLSFVCRVCAHVVVSEKPEYILEICPEAEDGLASQNYRCAECLAHIHFNNNNEFKPWMGKNPKKLIISYLLGMNNTFRKDNTTGSNFLEPRLCDYTGKYYCSTCHWNSTSVIPGRVILNWDFTERYICRSSKQILQLMWKLPILKLEELNPMLFACIEELGTVKELRRQLMEIKKYITSCKSAAKTQLLWQPGDKVHFLENEDSYSLKDLFDLRSGDLIEYLNKIKDDFIRHIQVECEVCRGRGFYCEFCEEEKAIFPFEENVVCCCKCHAAFHFFCWIKNNKECPKCSRIEQRLLETQKTLETISFAFDS